MDGSTSVDFDDLMSSSHLAGSDEPQPCLPTRGLRRHRAIGILQNLKQPAGSGHCGQTFSERALGAFSNFSALSVRRFGFAFAIDCLFASALCANERSALWAVKPAQAAPAGPRAGSDRVAPAFWPTALRTRDRNADRKLMPTGAKHREALEARPRDLGWRVAPPDLDLGLALEETRRYLSNVVAAALGTLDPAHRPCIVDGVPIRTPSLALNGDRETVSEPEVS